MNVVVTDNFEIKNKINLRESVYPKLCFRIWMGPRKVYSRHDATTFPKSIVHILNSFVIHSFWDCSDESCSFACSAKLFFWSQQFGPFKCSRQQFPAALVSWVSFSSKNQLLADPTVVIALHFLLKWTHSLQKIPDLACFQKGLHTNSTLLHSYWADFLNEWCALLTKCLLSPLRSE